MDYVLHLLIFFEIYVLVALSLNLVMGYGGLLQVAHAAYYGIGAYTYALLRLDVGMPFFVAVLGAALAAALLSLLISIPARKFQGDPFVMMSLAVQVGVSVLFYQWSSLTGGPSGMWDIPGVATPGSKLATQGSIAVTYGLIALAAAAAMVAFHRSPFGLQVQALRDDEVAAQAVGIPSGRRKVEVLALSCGLVGVAGALFAAYATFIDPTSFSLDAAILMVSMVVVGGTGNVRGPLVGAFVLIALPEGLRFLELPDATAAHLRLLAYGLLIVILMRVRPQGLAGVYRYE